MVERSALLINPPVYDTQYWGHWRLPHGLLKIGTFLRNEGYNVKLIDCLIGEDRDLVKKQAYLTVKCCSTEVRDYTPKKLLPDEKIKYIFGKSMPELRENLKKLKDNSFIPDEIWITSIMTYWWESTVDVIYECLDQFPKTKIRVGGIYPTLAPEHLKAKLLDLNFEDIDGKLFNVNDSKLQSKHLIVKGEIKEANDLDLSLDLYSHIEHKPAYSILTTSRGCPHNCAYCAGSILSGNKVRTRHWEEVLNEIRTKYEQGIREFCFYEDNLLMGMDNFESILEEIIRDNTLRNIELHAPEGVEINLVLKNPSIIKKMKEAGFDKIYLPLETINQDVNDKWNRSFSKTTNFERVLKLCEEAGFSFRTQGVNVFVLFGLPDEKIQDVADTIMYAASKVGSVIPMLFTPVPGTPVFDQYKDYIEEMGFDYQHLNGKLLPFLRYNQRKNKNLTVDDYLRLESLMFRINRKVFGASFDPYGKDKCASTFRKVFSSFKSISR